MRVTTLAFLVVLGALIAAGIVFHSWIFAHFDGFNQWRTGFKPAATPTEAMEKFRDAIQQRKYAWAASYCTKDYADVLVKCDGPASRLGNVIDKIRDYMMANKLQNDQTVVALALLDPFPRDFTIQGAVNERDSTGRYVWDARPNASFSQFGTGLDPHMFWSCLVPGEIRGAAPVKLVKEGEHWKLHIVPAPDQLESVRYFLDHSKSYENELGAFRTYMTNGRYDSPNAFHTEIMDSLKKAK